ncbi:MAG: PAS domain-containing protein [Chloroflexota bacterium]|nr:PAS domain-containing protein [Chloroflexota bacterium]
MMDPRHVLLVEDNPEDRVLIKAFLSRIPDYQYYVTEAKTGEEMLRLCSEQSFDCLLLDYMLPDTDGLELIAHLRATRRSARLPIIIMTGQGSESIAVRAIKSGAQDYLTKAEYTSEKLHIAITNAIGSVRLQTALRETEERYRALVNATSQIVWTMSPEGKAIFATNGWEALTGQADVNMLDDGWIEAVHPDERARVIQTLQDTIASRQTGTNEFRVQARDGSYRDVEVRVVPIFDEDGTLREWAGITMDVTARKNTERELQRSNARYQALIDATAQNVWRMSGSGDAVYETTAWQDMTGQSQEELQDKGWLEVIHPDDREHMLNVFHETLRAKTVYRNEFRVRSPEGSYRDIESRATPIFNNAGELQEWIGLDMDVTARKKAERELQRANERFRLAAQAVHAIIFDWDLTTDRVERTVGITDMLGYVLDEVQPVRQWWFDRIHLEDLPGALEIVDTALQAKDSYSVEHRMLHKNGNIVYVWERGIIVRDPAGKPVRVVGSTIDVTQIRLTQQRLSEQEAFLAHVANNITALVFLYDLQQHRNVYINGQIGPLLGYTPQEVNEMGDSLLPTLMHPDDLRVSINTVQTLLASPPGTTVQTEYRMRHKNGEWRWFWGHDRIIDYDRNGKPLHTLGIAYDITEQKEIEAHKAELLRLEQIAREKAEEANRTKVQFVGMISHDLRTPLSSIKGFTTTLLADDVTFDPAQQRKFLGIIDQETDKLTELIDHLLEISRIQAGTFTIELEHVHVHDIFAFAEHQLNTLAKNHVLKIEVSPELPPVTVDVRRIGQVLTNLVGNAVKFAPAGTEIGICAERQNGMVVVEVCDQGPGIPPDKRSAIFEAFSQLQSKQASKGVGLGLAICKSIVTAHGGTIWAADAAPQGTRMCFTLPAANGTHGDIQL